MFEKASKKKKSRMTQRPWGAMRFKNPFLGTTQITPRAERDGHRRSGSCREDCPNYIMPSTGQLLQYLHPLPCSDPSDNRIIPPMMDGKATSAGHSVSNEDVYLLLEACRMWVYMCRVLINVAKKEHPEHMEKGGYRGLANSLYPSSVVPAGEFLETSIPTAQRPCSSPPTPRISCERPCLC